MHELIVPLLGSLVLALVGWFAMNRYGRSLVSFWDLRKNVQQALSLSPTLVVSEAKCRLGDLAAETDAICNTLPFLLSIFLRWICRYDLDAAARGLAGLSNSIGGDVYETADFRVQAQESLRLRIDPKDRELAERWRRLKSAVFLRQCSRCNGRYIPWTKKRLKKKPANSERKSELTT